MAPASFLKHKFYSWFQHTSILFYPLLIIIFVGIWSIPSSKDYFNEVVSFGLLSLLCFAFVTLLLSVTFSKIIFLIFYLGLTFFAFVKLSFYQHYDVKLSASALFVIFETNGAEASDFLVNYFSFEVIAILLLLILPLFYWIWLQFFQKKEQMKINVSRPKSMLIKIALFLIIPVSFYFIQKHYRTNNIIITALGSYQEYLQTKENLKASLAQENSDYLVVHSGITSPQTHVIIIGESTTNWHMQLYGYNRETNPLLIEIKDELIVFDSVIAPHVHTILSLEKVLTLSNFNDPDKDKNGSVVQLANAGGYETYWISNQKPVGIHESVTTIIGSAAKHKYFMATDDYQAYYYDENILPALDRVLAQDQERKIIFIQLIGTHIAYKKRYPDSFRYFDDKEPLSYKNQKEKTIINEYDNSVRYNDFIIRSIIDKVKSQGLNSSVLYFSDHGDDVFDVMDYAGHNEFHATRPMFEVPFILWLSEKYKKQRPDLLSSEILSGRRYSLEDFIHSFSDLSDIRFEGFDASRSIFNEGFIKRTRIIKDSINYDERN